MEHKTISVKVEAKMREEAHQVASELGFSLSSLVNAFLKQLIREKTVNFSLGETGVILSDDVAKEEGLSVDKDKRLSRVSGANKVSRVSRTSKISQVKKTGGISNKRKKSHR